MTALLKARLKVSFQDLGGVLAEIALSIGIRDTYINDAICAASPKAAYKQVSAKLISVFVQVMDVCRSFFPIVLYSILLYLLVPCSYVARTPYVCTYTILKVWKWQQNPRSLTHLKTIGGVSRERRKFDFTKE
jgi:hypothetical protein